MLKDENILTIKQQLNLNEVGGVEEQSRKTTSNSAGDGNGQDSAQKEETNALEVDGLVGTVAETNTDGGAGFTH